MALTLAQRHALLIDQNLFHRTKSAVLKTAQYVLSGGIGENVPAVKANAKFAAETNATSDATKFMGYIAWNTEEADQANITDAAIQFVVDSKYMEIWGA